MKTTQLSTLSRAIKNISLTGGIFFNFILINSAYAQACLNDTNRGLDVIRNISCNANQNSYSSEEYFNFAIRALNGATINILNDNVYLVKDTLSIEPNTGTSVLEAADNSTINVEHKITIDMNVNQSSIVAINAFNNSTIKLNDIVIINHKGSPILYGAGLAAHSNGGQASRITANNLVKVTTTGAVGILVRDGSSIILKEIDLTIGNNGNPRNFGVYASNKANILYTSGIINSSGSALKAENYGEIKSISTSGQIIKFIEVTDTNTLPSGIDVIKIRVINDGSNDVLASDIINSREITVLKNNADVTQLNTNEYQEISISARDTEIFTSNDSAHALYAKDNNSQILLAGDLGITTTGTRTSGLYVENSGRIAIDGMTSLMVDGNNSTGLTAIGTDSNIILKKPIYLNFIGNSGTGINNSNNAVITLLGNVTSTGEETAIDNNNATLNLYGVTNIFAGDIKNTNLGIINFYGATNTFGKNSSTNNNAIINFHVDNTFNGGLKNTDRGIINFYEKNNTFTNNLVNENKGVLNLNNYDPDTSNPNVYQKLNINGTYTGGNSQATSGVLRIDTKLGSDDLSKNNTDFITIGGGASGSTELKVINAGGNGARTYNKGIHIIQTQTSTLDAFYLAGGAVSAGAYDYGLFLDSNNWYLRSHRNDGGVDEDLPVYTPDVGEYLAAETMGNTLFTSRLEDREGASQYQNLGDGKDVGNVWVRASGGHNQFKTMESQLKTTGNSFVTQIGAGLVTLGEEDQYNLGAMTGFAYYDGKTRSNISDRTSKTKIDGYSLGLYGTWYAHPVEKRGAYIDSWVLWNKFNNKIDTPDQNQYKFNSSGVTASIEMGGDYLINKNGKKNWWIQPQGQVIYQGVHAHNFKDAQGVDIYHGKDNVQMRMGVKTYLNIPTNGNKLTSYRPYVALNFIHNTNPYSVVIDDVHYENEGSANLGELKLGVEGNVTKNSQVWLNASYVAGSHSNQAYQGNIGWKYNF